MEFDLMLKRALEVRQHFSQFEKQTIGRPWTAEEVALGFVVDVGDLMRLVMAANGVRIVQDVDKKLPHELADCLWSIMILSSLHNIDLQEAFTSTMNELEQYLTGN